jgi:hypothetical protein
MEHDMGLVQIGEGGLYARGAARTEWQLAGIGFDWEQPPGVFSRDPRAQALYTGHVQ